jgi:hypothetical protein
MSALDKQIDGTHYKDMPIQPIEFITKNKLDWYQGNIVKYASRHHNKGGADDLRKVIHYAELALEAQYSQPVADAQEKKEDKWQYHMAIGPVGPTGFQSGLQYSGSNHMAIGPVRKESAAPDDDWIEWNGGDCPVGPDVRVGAVTRGGYQCTRRAGDLWWNHIDVLSDIIKYRVVK